MSEEKNKSGAESVYNADQIMALEGMEHVRMRPSMYIGDVNVRGLHHLVYEVVDNSIDEALADHCDRIDVWITKDNGILASENKMSRMMTQIGFTTTSITRRGKRVRYYKGVKEMDDSRGWVGY